jgi:hypothetical protein
MNEAEIQSVSLVIDFDSMAEAEKFVQDSAIRMAHGAHARIEVLSTEVDDESGNEFTVVGIV